MTPRVKPSEIAQRQLAPTDRRFAPLLNTVVAQLQKTRSVAAVAISGSIASGTADHYSDLDLQCVVDQLDPDVAGIVRAAVHAAHEVGDERWTVPGRILSTVGVDWLRVDITLLDTSDAIAHDALIVWQRSSDGAEPPRAPAPEFVADADALTRRASRFLRSIGLVVRDVKRGDLRLGCWATEFLIDELISLMYLDRGIVRGAQKGTYRQLPAEDVEVIQGLPVALPEPTSIITAHIALADEYLGRARRLAERWDARWPQAMEDGTRLFLHEHLGSTFTATV
jgi:predicted nucleotidyltransferase